MNARQITLEPCFVQVNCLERLLHGAFGSGEWMLLEETLDVLCVLLRREIFGDTLDQTRAQVSALKSREKVIAVRKGQKVILQPRANTYRVSLVEQLEIILEEFPSQLAPKLPKSNGDDDEDCVLAPDIGRNGKFQRLLQEFCVLQRTHAAADPILLLHRITVTVELKKGRTQKKYLAIGINLRQVSVHSCTF